MKPCKHTHTHFLFCQFLWVEPEYFMTLIMTTIPTYLEKVRRQTIVSTVLQDQHRIQMELFILCVRVSHSYQRQQCNVRAFFLTLSLCFVSFIDFHWPHAFLNPSTTNYLPVFGIQAQHRPLHSYLLNVYLV